MDENMSKLFEFFSSDKFDMVLKGFELNPENARSFLEVCVETRITIESDPPGLDWRDLPRHEIVGMAKTMAEALRKQYFSH